MSIGQPVNDANRSENIGPTRDLKNKEHSGPR